MWREGTARHNENLKGDCMYLVDLDVHFPEPMLLRDPPFCCPNSQTRRYP